MFILCTFGNPVSASANDSSWKATFYPKIDFSGQAIIKTYTKLDFSWGSNSPDARIPRDNFSAVFEKKVTVSNPGTFKFTGRVDDGIRVYVDGKMRINMWNQGVHSINQEIYLTEGTHQLKIQYYEKKWSASLSVNLERINENFPSDSWSAEFYPTADFTGLPVKKSFPSLNFYYGSGSPSTGIPSDHFSAIFRKQIYVDKPGKYKLVGRADDGVRVYVDGYKKVDLWKSGINPFNGEIYLTPGNHKILIEYYDDRWSSSFSFDIQKVVEEIPKDKWEASYFSNQDFTGKEINGEYDNLNFYWGSNSPDSSIPSDHFSGVFTKQIVVDKAGNYTIKGKADDGIRVYIDGIKYVDIWKDGVNIIDVPITMEAGSHIITVEYYDSKYSATLNLDIQPIPDDEAISTQQWRADFYPTKDFTGNGVAKYYDDLNFYWGANSPDSAIPVDNFSGIFTKQYKIEKTGKYRFVGKADDGIRIEVDGVKVVDIWKDGVNIIDVPITLTAGTHTVTVEYYDSKYSATLNLDLIEDVWKATFYPSTNFSGTPITSTYDEMNLYWSNSPFAGIPSDDFSAIFEKKIFINKSSKYKISGKADDGIRIYVDGVREIDDWKDGINYYSYSLDLTQGIHTIRVEYYDHKYSASLTLDLSELIKEITTKYTNYPISIDQLLSKEIGVSLTDKKYNAYVRSDLFEVNSSTPSIGTIKGDSTNVRGVPVNGWILGKLNKGDFVTLYEKTKESDGYYWYRINYNETWVNANPTDIKYYLDPSNFNTGTSSYYQFLSLSQSAGVDANEVNQKILAGKGSLIGKAQIFIDAGVKNKINEIYLISHALLETGNGTSQLATGVKVKKKLDSSGNTVYDPDTGEAEINVLASNATSYDAIVYNMYGIGAYDSCPIQCGARKAFNEGWTTPDKAIIGGAEFVAENYIQKGQDTIYKMKWNPVSPGTHQYASDIGWAVKQTPTFYKLYSLLDSYKILFDVPRYNY